MKLMEPLFFKPVYKNIIWGGNNIAKIFDRKIIGDDIGESWELSAHQNRIKYDNGYKTKGKKFIRLI